MSPQAGSAQLPAPKEQREGPGLNGQWPWDESDGSSRPPARGLTIPEKADWLQVLKPLCAKPLSRDLWSQPSGLGPKTDRGWERGCSSPESDDSGVPEDTWLTQEPPSLG